MWSKTTETAVKPIIIFNYWRVFKFMLLQIRGKCFLIQTSNYLYIQGLKDRVGKSWVLNKIQMDFYLLGRWKNSVISVPTGSAANDIRKDYCTHRFWSFQWGRKKLLVQNQFLIVISVLINYWRGKYDILKTDHLDRDKQFLKARETTPHSAWIFGWLSLLL